MNFRVASMVLTGYLQNHPIDFFELKEPLEKRFKNVKVFSGRNYLTVYFESGVKANLFSNGRVVLFSHNRKKARKASEELEKLVEESVK